jgi:hypothetical protein
MTRVPYRCYSRRFNSETVKSHFQKEWDSVFLAGAEPNDTRVVALVAAAVKTGIKVAREYRPDYPAKGLSGVMVTRVPLDFQMPRSIVSRWNPAGGL